MPLSFSDRIKSYNSNKTAVVPVNPPEAVKVLETQSAPEVASIPSPVADAPSVPEPAKRTRRTKAEMEAAKSASGAEPSAEAPTQEQAPAASSVPSGFAASIKAKLESTQEGAPVGNASELTTEQLVEALIERGYRVTLVVG